MAKTEETISVSPRTLAWARNAIGLELSAAASASGIPEATIESFETGGAEPTYRQLRRLAGAYHRPIAVLLMSTPPKSRRAADFRAAAGKSVQMSPELLLAIRDARGQRDIALELAKELGKTFTFEAPTVSAQESPDAAAGKLRQWLDADPIAAGARGDGAYRFWRIRFEEKGILALQFSGIETEEASGFSIAEAPLPVVSVNSSEPYRRRLFTLFHELTHVALGHESAVCHLDDASRVEVFCNAVAGAALVPKEALLAHKWVQGADSETEWSEYRLSRLATPYGVSNEMMLRRLLDLKRTSKEFYRQRRSFYQTALARKQREKQERREKEGFAAPAVVQRSRLGDLYAGLALEAYEAGTSTLHETCERLGLSVPQTRKLQTELHKRMG